MLPFIGVPQVILVLAAVLVATFISGAVCSFRLLRLFRLRCRPVQAQLPQPGNCLLCWNTRGRPVLRLGSIFPWRSAGIEHAASFVALTCRRFPHAYREPSIAFIDDKTQHVRDYISWRQADCHINNLYNTCFWALVGDGEDQNIPFYGDKYWRFAKLLCVRRVLPVKRSTPQLRLSRLCCTIRSTALWDTTEDAVTSEYQQMLCHLYVKNLI